MKNSMSKNETNVKQAVLVKSDEWQGFYINGELVYERHHIGVKDLIRIYNEDIFHMGTLKICWVTDDYELELEKNGGLPERLSDVELEDG